MAILAYMYECNNLDTAQGDNLLADAGKRGQLGLGDTRMRRSPELIQFFSQRELEVSTNSNEQIAC